MVRPRLGPALALLLLATPAAAQSSSAGPAAGKADGATTALRRTLETYLTAIPFDRGILRVEADPAGQRVTIDPAPALSQMAGTAVRFQPLRFLLNERPDGNWDVASDDAVDVEASPTIEGQTQTFLYRQDSQSFRGVFSPELAAFLQAESKAEGTRNEQRDAVSNSLATIRSSRFTTSATPNAAGGADIAFQQRYEGFGQTTTVQIPEAEGTPFNSFGFEVTADGVRSEGRIEGARTVPIRDLYALVLRQAGPLETDARPAFAGPFGEEFKTALRRVLPLWGGLTGSASADALRVSSLYGDLTVGEARQDLRFSGVADDAGFDIDMALSKLVVASPLLPPWAASLLPEEMALGFAVSGVDLAAPAAIALDEVDFRQDPPLSPDAQARIAAAFDTTKLRSVLKPSRIRAKDYDIAFGGEFRFAGEQPEARIAVDMGGLDTAIATLQGAAATQPELHQAVGMLQFAKGVGRPRPDGRLEWIVEAGADGSVTVNGTMLKGPDPAVDPDMDDGAGTDGVLPPGDYADPDGDAPGASDL